MSAPHRAQSIRWKRLWTIITAAGNCQGNGWRRGSACAYPSYRATLKQEGPVSSHLFSDRVQRRVLEPSVGLALALARSPGELGCSPDRGKTHSLYCHEAVMPPPLEPAQIWAPTATAACSPVFCGGMSSVPAARHGRPGPRRGPQPRGGSHSAAPVPDLLCQAAAPALKRGTAQARPFRGDLSFCWIKAVVQPQPSRLHCFSARNSGQCKAGAERSAARQGGQRAVRGRQRGSGLPRGRGHEQGLLPSFAAPLAGRGGRAGGTTSRASGSWHPRSGQFTLWITAQRAPIYMYIKGSLRRWARARVGIRRAGVRAPV